MKLLRKYFFNKEEMSEKDYSYARIGFIADTAFVTGAACFLTGSYLTGLLGILGATEAQSNFILSLSMPAGFLQLLTPLIARKLTFRKGFIFFSRLFETLLPAIAFLLPLLFPSAGADIIWLIGLLFFTKHIFGWTASPLHSDMLMNCLSKDGGIGKFSGVKNSVANTVSCIGSFSAGRIIKHFSGNAQIYGFMWMAVIALAFMVIDGIFLFFIKEPYIDKPKIKQQVSLAKIFTDMFKIPKMKTYLKYHIACTAGSQMVSSIVNIITIQRLNLNLEIISYLSVTSLLGGILISPLFGKLSDRIGAKKMMFYGTLLSSVYYILHGVMTESNVLILKIISTVISCLSGATINAPSFSFMFESMPTENRSSYMSCSSVLTLIVSYIASLCATAFISAARGLNITVFGFVFHELNILLFIGASIISLSSLTLISKKQDTAD